MVWRLRIKPIDGVAMNAGVYSKGRERGLRADVVQRQLPSLLSILN